MSIVAGNVKRIMNDRGLKQYSVAKQSGIAEKTFSNMLNGRKIVSEMDIIRMAGALGVEPNELFARQESA